MKNMNLKLSIALGLALVNGVFANNPTTEIENFDINSIQYIEEEIEIDLGFDSADYLPEGFDPYKMYVDLNAIVFVEDENVIDAIDLNLPEGFDAYAYPTDVAGMNYIDENDEIQLNFDSKGYLPAGFDPYIK